MYEAFFGLREKPFSILPDPKFLFFSRHHRIAYAMLEYGIVNQAGFTIVTGAIGSGKTTLVRKLVESLEGDVVLAVINNTSQTLGGLLEWIMMAFRQPFEGKAYPRLFMDFQSFLHRVDASGKRAVLVIDEAQNLSPAVLEELRMLSNANIDSMMLQLILVGQPELRDILRAPELVQFAQRVSSDYHLQPLSVKDAIAYIDHRIMVAGGRPDLFTRSAKTLICSAADGVPRTINIIADRCLVYAFGANKGVVTKNTARTVIADMQQYGITLPAKTEEASPPGLLD
jgi:type II secretory pathway predicted ATPase ExeA